MTSSSPWIETLAAKLFGENFRKLCDLNSASAEAPKIESTWNKPPSEKCLNCYQPFWWTFAQEARTSSDKNFILKRRAKDFHNFSLRLFHDFFCIINNFYFIGFLSFIDGPGNGRKASDERVKNGLIESTKKSHENSWKISNFEFMRKQRNVDW